MIRTTDNPIQTDEAKFAGRWKYNRGRMLIGDNAPLSVDSVADQENNRNHRRRIDAGLQSRRKNAGSGTFFMNMAPAPAPDLLVIRSVAPAPEISLFIAWLRLQLRLLFVFTHVFNPLGVPQLEWKMNSIKCTKLREYTKLFLIW